MDDEKKMTQASSLTLLLPDLAPTTGAAWPAMPALQTLLSRGNRERSSGDYLTTLFALFGVAGGEEELPVAALYALGAGLEAEGGWWLCADPVHLLADRDQLILSAYRELALNRAEADALVAELNRLYAGDGWLFIATSPQRWLLRLPQPLAMHTTPTEQALGCRLGAVLPRGADAMVWQRVMTEAQMLLHASVVNARRTEEGLLAVNGLWFWGGGSLPEAATECGWDHVIANDCLSRGLARLHSVATAEPSSTTLSEWSQVGERVLWVDDTLQAPLPTTELFAQVEDKLFAPLLTMLKSGELSQLVIEFPGVGRWAIDRAALRRWWRRNKTLAVHLNRN